MTMTMVKNNTQSKTKLISETRQRFKAEFVIGKPEKYDFRDLERLQQDDHWVESYLSWQHDMVDETLKMIDESFQWRREMSVNDLSESSIPRRLLEIGGIYVHGYDKEGNRLLWMRVKYHSRDPKTALDEKKLLVFWLERYARRENGKPLTVMFDLSETGMSNIDMDFTHFILNCFKIYYPKYISKIVIFDMPWIMNAAFKVLKSWLGPEAVSLLKHTGKNDIQDYVSAKYLPPYMGGTDPFKYSYPPLVDDDLQSPLRENGPIHSEDEGSSQEGTESDRKEACRTISKGKRASLSSKIDPPKGEGEEVGPKVKTFKKPLSVFKGPLLHISPAEELCFGSTGFGEKEALIMLTNVTKNIVAFKVKATVPEKYQVKPSNSSCEPGASVDIVVCPQRGFTVSAQDRFLILAAEIRLPQATDAAKLRDFWNKVPRCKVMEHRIRCQGIQNSEPNVLIPRDQAEKGSEAIALQLYQILESQRKLESQVRRCLWLQQLLLVVTVLSLAFVISFFYLLYS